jgi:hemoglobin-like flavoprotein
MPIRWPWSRRAPTPEPVERGRLAYLEPEVGDHQTAWRIPIVTDSRMPNDMVALISDRDAAVIPIRKEPDVTDTEPYDPHTEDRADADDGVFERRAAHASDAETERIDTRDDCPHCMGTGRVLTTNDYLRMSIDLLGDQGDKVVAEFYARLLTEAPELASLFPADLVDPLAGAGSPGRIQRDKLLGALVAVSQTYDRDNPKAMEILDTHLATFGRSHANFQRSNGTVRGATLAEYHAVKVVLFGTLHDAAGEAWRPEFDDAWSEAYDYAVGEMLHAQNHTDLRSPRYPRPSR